MKSKIVVPAMIGLVVQATMIMAVAVTLAVWP